MSKSFLVLSAISALIFTLLYINIFSKIWITRNPVDAAVSQNYYFHPLTKQVYYSQYGSWFSHGLDAISDSHREQFRVLNQDLAVSRGVFVFKDQKFPSVDVDSAQPMPDEFPYYVKDVNAVFILDSYLTTLQKIPEADPQSFQPVGDSHSHFARDKDSIYRRGIRIPDVKPDDFQALDYSVFRNGKELVMIFQEPDAPKEVFARHPIAGTKILKVNNAYFDGVSLFYGDHTEKKIIPVPVKDPTSVRVQDDKVHYDGKIL